MGDTGSTRRSSRQKRIAATTSGGGGFLPDLKDVLTRYHKRTSAAHKRSVLLLVLLGAALRGWLLFEPITADEAFMWVQYGVLPVGEVVSDLGHSANHVFHTLLVQMSTGLFGLDKVTIRLPAYLSGVLAMPLFYLFVRAMFNRYIALMTLALVAGSGGLLELSALASGHAVVWLLTCLALVFGRHFLKQNSPVSAIGMGVALALALWTMPGGLYPALMVMLWSLFHILVRHSETVPQRIRYWFLALGVLVVLTLMLYSPIIINHSITHIFHHDSLPDLSWKKFKLVHTEGTMALWFHLVDVGSAWFAIVGLIGVLVAAFISQKYRMLAFAMLLGASVPVLLIRYVPEPETWTYTLFIFHLSTAIVLFYALKFVQERLLPDLGKRTRVGIASLVLVGATAWPAMDFLLETDRQRRFPEAEVAANFLNDAMGVEDRVHAAVPWKDPLLFHLMCLGWTKGAMQGLGKEGSYLYVLIDPGSDQTVESVLYQQAVDQERLGGMKVLLEQGRIKIFGTRTAAAGDVR
jgi:4-amino-4-deoxy-L-arabinose transferase-like glycosyltransferase